MNFDSTLDGKVAVVTGAGRGIGEAIACAYAGAGAAVCAAARTRAEIDSTAEKIRQAGGSAISIVADVRDPDSVQHLVDATVREFGGLDIFVVNAGVHLDRSRIEDSDPELWKVINQTIKDVTEDTESIDKMNTAISKMMVFVNAATQATTLSKEVVKTFLRLLAPYAPHIVEELWQHLGEEGLIVQALWPTYDPEALKREEVTIVVQINGKLRSRIQLPVNTNNEEAEASALANEHIQNYVAGKAVRKVIVVPNRLVNIVV